MAGLPVTSAPFFPLQHCTKTVEGPQDTDVDVPKDYPLVPGLQSEVSPTRAVARDVCAVWG